MSFPKQGLYEEFAVWRDSLEVGDAVVVINWNVGTSDPLHTVNQCVRKLTPTQIVVNDGRRFKRVGSCQGIGAACFCQIDKPEFVARRKSLEWMRKECDLFPLPHLSSLMAITEVLKKATAEQAYSLAILAAEALAKQDAAKEGEV